MSRLSFLEKMKLTNRMPNPANYQKRVAILGIGNEFCGDDAAGILAVRLLSDHLNPIPGLLLLEAGTAPENCTSALRRFEPDVVLLIDSAQFGGLPGEVRSIRTVEIKGCSASTHTLPLGILADYLEKEIRCQITLIGIQPATVEYGTPVSPRVLQSVQILATALASQLKAGLNSPGSGCESRKQVNEMVPCVEDSGLMLNYLRG